MKKKKQRKNLKERRNLQWKKKKKKVFSMFKKPQIWSQIYYVIVLIFTTHERWVSPDLGCFESRETRLFEKKKGTKKKKKKQWVIIIHS